MIIKNRLHHLLLSFIIGSFFLVSSVGSVEAARLRLSPSSGEVSSGSKIEVYIDTEDTAVDSTVAVITFDPNRVEISSITPGSFFDSVSTDTSRSGEVAITGTLSIGNIEGKTGSGILSTLTITPKVTSGNIVLGFRCSAADIDDSNIMSTEGSNLLATDEQCGRNVGGNYSVGSSSGGGSGSTTQPQGEATTQDTTKGEQPVLPAQLPESGFKDLFAWFVSGLALLGIGLLLL